MTVVLFLRQYQAECLHNVWRPNNDERDGRVAGPLCLLADCILQNVQSVNESFPTLTHLQNVTVSNVTKSWLCSLPAVQCSDLR
jgi:hypothetical protein